jgi:hypothetical protein
MVLSTVSGVLFGPLAYIAAASGLCVLYPELALLLTLGALDSPTLCLRLHTSPILQVAVVVVGAVHAYSTAELLAARTRDAPVMLRLLRDVYRGMVLVLAALTVSIVVVHYAY